MKKTVIFTLSAVMFSAFFGCRSEKVCIPPKQEEAQQAFAHVAPYTETLWHTHYNTDESKVRKYTLPQFTSKSVSEWENIERPRILQQFKDIMYGKMPPAPDKIELELLAQKDDAFNGLAIRKEMRVHCIMNNGRRFDFDMMIYIPKNAKTPPPVFVGLNFSGNQANTPERDVLMTRGMYYRNNTFRPLTARAARLDSWNFEETIKRGYAVATACYWELCPDFMTGIQASAFTLFYDKKDLRMDFEVPFAESKAGKWRRPVGVIAAWSWGMSRILDVLENEPLVDAKRAAVIGHSRLGKAALWAGATDQRFQIVISNNSGCGGAALSRRNFGENLQISFWEQRGWYTGNLVKYIENVDSLPIDQHMLLALVAPRTLCVASATKDLNADPKGEFLSAYEASKIWKLYGKTDVPSSVMPDADTPVGTSVRYHLRSGRHAITAKDWECYYDLADKTWKK